MQYTKLSQATRDELKEFFDRLPFKIGDKVIYQLHSKNGFISDISFDGFGKVTYLISYDDEVGGWFYKEEIAHKKDRYIVQSHGSNDNPKEVYIKYLYRGNYIITFDKNDASIFSKKSDFDVAAANGYLPIISHHYWRMVKL